MNEKIKALFALSVTILLWSLSVVISRSVVQEISPLILLFLRLFVAAIAFLPFFIKRKIWKHPHFFRLIKVSATFMINMTFFLIGIKYTSASASQLIYGATPILILIISILFLKEKFQLNRLVGVLIGLIGVLIIIYLSAVEKGTTISGSLLGNLLIGIAMVGWLSYMFATKELLKTFSAVDTSSVAIIVSFLLSIPLFLIDLLFIKGPVSFSLSNVSGVFFIGFFGTFVTYLLHQYALSRLSTLVTSFTSYIQPLTTLILEIILLGEKLTSSFLFGGALVFFGVFLATTLEFYQRRK